MAKKSIFSVVCNPEVEAEEVRDALNETFGHFRFKISQNKRGLFYIDGKFGKHRMTVARDKKGNFSVARGVSFLWEILTLGTVDIFVTPAGLRHKRDIEVFLKEKYTL